MMEHSLAQLGWNRTFEAAMAPFVGQGFEPARVIAEHRGAYRVATATGEMAAEVTGRLMHLAEDRLDYPVVGDWVAAAVLDQGELAVIHAVLPRTSVLARKSAGRKFEGQAIAANVDIVFVVIGMDHNFNLNRMERYLAAAAGTAARPVALLSKSDLAPDADAALRSAAGRSQGAEVLAVSSRTGAGMERLQALLTEGVTACFIGSSGVGKSSIINHLAGRELLRTAEVREGDSRGRHTTTHRELFLLPSGGIVIDTPGMRELGLWDAGAGIERAFGDIEALVPACAFRDCTHRVEPGCAVRDAVERGDLDRDRYESFLKLGREQEHLEAKTDWFKLQVRKAHGKSIAKAVKELYNMRYNKT
ncbi:MAG: ribosome small subunit-dependent GTPase A [Nitrospirota bacterium]|nr:ribosome small subunit-dependent GTPase A [Nitrospirota bacterium]